MRFCGPVREGVWLAIAGATAPDSAGAQYRLPRDRAAAARAEVMARAALGLPRGGGAVSRSHTLATGAALVASSPISLGVDIVRIYRVGLRHADSILNADEWEALACHPMIRPALGWALKEAGAKAGGDPLRLFPNGVIIEAGQEGPVVRLAGGESLTTGWVVIGELLCAWVVPEAGPRPTPPPTPPLRTEAPPSEPPPSRRSRWPAG